MHVVPVLAEFDSTLKVFTQLVDFGRTGTLRDFETWSVVALVKHLGNDCYVDEAGLVGPTGPSVDRWLSGEPLETAELARFRTNGSHTVALLMGPGPLGPLACAFKVLGAIEGLHLKSILEGPTAEIRRMFTHTSRSGTSGNAPCPSTPLRPAYSCRP